jgi:hypothetical protein
MESRIDERQSRLEEISYKKPKKGAYHQVDAQDAAASSAETWERFDWVGCVFKGERGAAEGLAGEEKPGTSTKFQKSRECSVFLPHSDWLEYSIFLDLSFNG